MKKLLLITAIVITAVSCKKETPPTPPVDNSTAKDYYTIASRNVVNSGSRFTANLNVTVSNADKINSMVIKRVNNYSLLPDFNLKLENTTQSTVYTNILDIFTSNPFQVDIVLKSGKVIKDFFIF